MRFSFLFSSAVLVAADLAAQQRSASHGYASSDQIRTSATATRSIPPELAVARFEFSARDSTLSGAARGAAAIGDAIRRAVAKAGVPEDSIRGRGSLTYPWDQSTQMEVKPNAEFKRYDTTYVFSRYGGGSTA